MAVDSDYFTGAEIFQLGAPQNSYRGREIGSLGISQSSFYNQREKIESSSESGETDYLLDSSW